MEEIDKLKKLRTVTRGLTTKLIGKIETTLGDEEESTDEKLRELLELLIKKAQLLKKI